MKKRLVELIKQAENNFSKTGKPVLDIEEYVASYLLANGVIVQAQGHWIEQSDGWDGALYTCSACRCYWCTIDGTPVENNMRYCPECGAKMSDVIERSNENAD